MNNSNNIQQTKHVMYYNEREELKAFARRGENLEQTVIMIAHWMSCMSDVSFTDYASNWAIANTRENVNAMRIQWPLTKSRMIADDLTTWGIYSA